MTYLLTLLMLIDWDKFETQPHPKQQSFLMSCLDAEKQYVAAFCGLQSGKTLAMCDAGSILLYGEGEGFQPIMLPEGIRGKTPMEVWLVSKSYALADVLFETFRWRTNPNIWATEREMRAWGLSKGDRYTHWLRPRPGLEEDQCPIKLRVRTASDPDSMRATPTLGLALCDELAYWKQRAWDNLQARAIVARTKFVITTTPRGKNFVYRQIAVPGGYGGGAVTDQSVAVHTWTSKDNPYADKKHIAKMERVFGREYAKQELQALFTDQVGYVYGDFDRSIHMVEPPSQKPEDYDIIVGGIDPGMRDPYACVVFGKHQGKWYQLWEAYETGKTDMQMAPMLLVQQEKWGVKTWYTDKRRPSDISNLRTLGVRAQPNIDIHRENDTKTIAPMVAVIKNLLSTGKLFIGKDHECTAEEYERYHFPDEVDEREKNTNDTPVDWQNHLMDATRYCCPAGTMIQTADGAREIETIRDGDLILTSTGYHPTRKAGLTRYGARLLKLTTTSGAVVEATADHPFWTDKGWKTLDCIRPCDTVYTWNTNGLSSKASSTTDTQSQSIGLCDSTITIVADELCTGPSTDQFTEISLRDITSTTGITTLQTTTRKTSKLFRERSTQSTISTNTDQRIAKSSASAYGAATPLRVPRHGLGSALTPVSLRGEEPQGRTTSPDSASCAAKSSIQPSSASPSLVPLTVAHVSESRTADVYNLSVEVTPEYFANGILVHNCLCSTVEIVGSGPRYRQGPRGTPQEIKKESTERKIISVAETLAARDEQYELIEARNEGKGRNSSSHYIRNRLRTKGRLN